MSFRDDLKRAKKDLDDSTLNGDFDHLEDVLETFYSGEELERKRKELREKQNARKEIILRERKNNPE